MELECATRKQHPVGFLLTLPIVRGRQRQHGTAGYPQGEPSCPRCCCLTSGREGEKVERGEERCGGREAHFSFLSFVQTVVFINPLAYHGLTCPTAHLLPSYR